ncbi:LIC11661 family lipoprotein [Leptospira haakeii]|uniref:Lipoprotein n=1 Tax=Leptospira haakeii TaxID=2023198 RepID=A0ABX4PLX9_9LEPT|nr:hypothetical protein [Leptospira haakeii]PKA15388.1 hypothetical protein CH363_14325 [Leptospira haakeii]PKA18783.1 hypothetical protein CH377_15530 [Leptospira haakeii]
MNLFLSRRMHTFFSILLLIFSLFSCYNYSTNRIVTTPPTLVGITLIGTGVYELRLRAGNPEAFFSGYTLYTGSTSDASRNPADFSSGKACELPLNMLPNQPKEYSIEVNPTAGPLAVPGAGENTNRVCKIVATLNSGDYVTLRSSVISLDLNSGTKDIYVFSMPSNTLQVP